MRTRTVLLALLVGLAARPAAAQIAGALGGIEGPASSAIEATPLFTMTGRADLAVGENFAGLAYSNVHFTRFSQSLRDQFGTDLAAESNAWSVFASMGLGNGFNLTLLVPYERLRFRSDSDRDGVVEKERFSGLGSPTLSIKKTIASNPDLAGRLKVVFPSGYEVGREGYEYDMDIGMSIPAGIFGIHTSAGYVLTLPNQSGFDRGRNPSDGISAAAAVASFTGRITGVLELLYVGSGGVLDPERNGDFQQRIDLAPGVKVSIGNSVLITAVRISLKNDFDSGYNNLYIIGFGRLL